MAEKNVDKPDKTANPKKDLTTLPKKDFSFPIVGIGASAEITK